MGACCVKGKKNGKKAHILKEKSLQPQSAEKPTQLGKDSLLKTLARPYNFTEDYDYMCLLGEGASSEIFLVAEKVTGTQRAVKAIECASNNDECIEELEIMSILSHPNIVRLHGAYQVPKTLFLAIDYCAGGDLYALLQQVDTLDESLAARYFVQIVSAVHYLHSLSIMHRDLKL